MLHVSLRVLLVALRITLGGAFSSNSFGQDAASAPADQAAATAPPAKCCSRRIGTSAVEPLSLETANRGLGRYIGNGDQGRWPI